MCARASVQKTGVAIETLGFTIVTSGKKRKSLTGHSTFELFPHFQPLGAIMGDGAIDMVTTEISTSKERRFPLVTLLDTPGLVDGKMQYAYPVEDAICWLADHCDLILGAYFCYISPSRICTLSSRSLQCRLAVLSLVSVSSL